jgi:hypothetical protein
MAGMAIAARPVIVSGAGPNGPKTTKPSDFVPRVGNPYFPLRPGTTFRYRGTKDETREWTRLEPGVIDRKLREP